jgi:hypothetical protein
MIVAVDEAQMFAPSAAGDVSEAARRTSLGAMTNLMCRGRKRGLCGIIATQRLAKLAKNVAAEASNFLMGRTFLDIDMERAADLLGLSTKQAEMFRDLNQGNFIGLGPALSRVPLSIRVGQVVTRARSGTPNMAPPPEKLDEDALGELLAPAPGATRAHVVRRPAPVKSDTETLIANVDSTERLQAADESVPDKPQQTDEDRAAMKRTYRDIVVGVMSTPDSDFAQEAALYQEFNVTCRLKGVPRIDLSAFRRLVPAARVGIDGATSEDPDWSRVLATADDLPPDRQAVYLLLARAAKAGDPCPSDIEFARKCGSASPGRGRARVEGLEKDAFITVKKDMRGKRVVSLPDFGWETAPGDQNGAA